MQKINSIHFGGLWLGIGGVLLVAFGIIFIIEMHQASGKGPHYEKHLVETIPFDSATQYAVIRSSICTGEQVAGFRGKRDGKFTEVMLIKTDADLERFKKMYHIESVKKEY